MSTTTSTRLCPNGCGYLAPVTLDSVRVERCVTCAGIYLDREMVQRMRRMPQENVMYIENAVAPANRKAAAKARRQVEPRPCPNCRTLMLPYEVSSRVPVTLDRCGTCDGIWADDRELEAVSGPSGDTDVHFDTYMSSEARDEMIMALYDESGPHRAGTPLEEAFAHVFPTFASWVRRPSGGA